MAHRSPIQESRAVLDWTVKRSREDLDRQLETVGNRVARLRELCAKEAPVSELRERTRRLVSESLDAVEIVGRMGQADELADKVFGVRA